MKLFAFLLGAGLGMTQAAVQAGDLTMALGGFNVDDSAKAMAQIEYRFAADWSGFRPQAGLFATEDSAAYAYAGLGYPVALGEQWALVPSVSAGYYHQGADKDLGYDLEFYSQLRLEYRLSAAAALGCGIGHISNAGIGDDNPGAETLYLSYRLDF